MSNQATSGTDRTERNADATRARIIQAATTEFAQKGFAGARMSSIVSAAGVNISLVYQYFGDKEGLYVRVMEEAYKIMRRYHREIELQGKAPAAAMEELVRSTFRIFLDVPELIGLLNTENVNEARFVSRSGDIKGLYNPLLSTIAEILERGARENVFRRDVDPVDLFITINALGYFYISNRHTLSFILHQPLMEPARIAQREDHIVAVVLGYLGCMPG